MASESNMGFHHNNKPLPRADWNRHAISFQSGPIISTTDMIPMGNYFGINDTNIFNNNSGITQARKSAGSLILDNYDNGDLFGEWSIEEQYKLEEGLVKYANELNTMKYVKIAATLQEKSVRDVVLRCKWMSRKRRRTEECSVGKRVKNKKDMLVESLTYSTSKTNIPSVSSPNIPEYYFMVHHKDPKDSVFYEVSSKANHLLEKNAQVFEQITANLSTYKLRDNAELFCQTRNNITAILNDMRDTSGIISQMPPLPVSIREDLVNSILPNSSKTQAVVFGSHNGIQIKQEPRSL